MPNTFELIASSTVGSGGATTFDFTSIPSTYTDLCLKWSARGGNVDPVEFVSISLNGSTSSFSSRFLRGRGSSVDSYTDTTLITQANGSTSTASTFSNGEIYIPNYAGSTNKSYSMDGVTENNATAADAVLGAGLWSATPVAINRVTITCGGGRSFVQYSTAYLYGVKNA
jgi:hypothetical protein